MTPLDIRLTPPDIADYLRLRAQTGWPPAAAPERALKGALFAATAWAEGRVIGMGRVVGDGVSVFYIEDLIVDQAHRGRGIGQALLDALSAEAAARAPGPAMLALLAAEGTEPFYAAAGFAPRPAPGYGAAMMQLLKGPADE